MFAFTTLCMVLTVCVIVLQEIEREDQAWEDSQRRRKPTRPGKNVMNENAKAKSPEPAKSVEEKIGPERPRSNAPRGFY